MADPPGASTFLNQGRVHKIEISKPCVGSLNYRHLNKNWSWKEMHLGSEARIPPGRSTFTRLADTLTVVARYKLCGAHQAFTLFFLMLPIRSRFFVVG